MIDGNLRSEHRVSTDRNPRLLATDPMDFRMHLGTARAPNG